MMGASHSSIAARLRAAAQPRAAPDMAAAAAWYARAGYAVIPLHTPHAGGCSCGHPECPSPGKHPRTTHGCKDATSDAATVAEWWTRWPEANIGIATGPEHNLLVIDLDPRNGGPSTYGELIDMLGGSADWPRTCEVMTGGGGRHLYFRYNAPGPVPSTLAEGIDVKYAGGYVLAPPSLHVSGNRYDVDDPRGAKAFLHVAPLPEVLIEVFKVRRAQRAPTPPPAADDVWPTGTRHTRMVSLAGTLRARGLSPPALAAALAAENQTRCSPPLPPGEVAEIAASAAKWPGGGTDAPWPPPEDLGEALPPVTPFTPDLLPAAFRDLAADVAERMQVPLDFPAVFLVLSLAGAVSRRAVIQPKERDSGWVVTPNLWGGVIAPPGWMKTPVIQAITRPLAAIEAEWRTAHAEALAEFAQAKEEGELRRSAWKDQFKAAIKRNGDAPPRPDADPAPPAARRLILVDATMEALHAAMAANPAGVLVVRDELTGWLTQLDRPGRESERAFALETWNGDTGFTVDRIARGTVHVPHACMSLLGGIQPARLRHYLSDAVHDGPNNDGLLQRFQLLVWPDTPADWEHVDRAPDARAEAEVEAVVRRVLALDPETPLRARFAPDAQALFNDWRGELEAKVRGDSLHPALVSHLAKYRSLMPSLALLFSLADGGSGTVSLAHTRQAAAWCDYLESHAGRIYACITTPAMAAARALAEKIRAGAIGGDGDFTAREVYFKDWAGLAAPDAVKAAAAVLVDAGWLRESTTPPGPAGGRPSLRWSLNPAVRP